MFYYYMHGLGICSELFFPELIKKKTFVDVVIKFGKVNSISEKPFKESYLRTNIKVRFISNKIYLFWNDIEICSIHDGNEIIISPQTGLEENLIRLIILGYAMAILLHQRGRLVLHASAVNMNGFGIGFLGSSGSGKSTTSLALHKNGYNLISDDMLSIKLNGDNSVTIFPSFPRIKLWPDVIDNIEETLKYFPKSHSNTEKRNYYVSENFSDISIPLRSIYLIEESNKTTIEKLKPQISLMEVIKSSYCYSIFDNLEIYNNLKQSVEISNIIPVKKLKVQRSFDNIHKIVQIIKKDNKF